jgi:hypothetical protein
VNAFDPGMMPGTGLARTYPAPLRFVWNSAEMTGLPSSLCCPCPTYLSDLARA